MNMITRDEQVIILNGRIINHLERLLTLTEDHFEINPECVRRDQVEKLKKINTLLRIAVDITDTI